MRIQYFNTSQWGIQAKKFNPLFRKISLRLGAPKGLISVIFVTDEIIHGLNLTTRRIDQPTDVLSYEYTHQPKNDLDLLGEIYISIDTVRRHAFENHRPFKNELHWVMVHGILHLYGYDHETDEDDEDMRKIECDILDQKICS